MQGKPCRLRRGGCHGTFESTRNILGRDSGRQIEIVRQECTREIGAVGPGTGFVRCIEPFSGERSVDTLICGVHVGCILQLNSQVLPSNRDIATPSPG